MTNIDQKTYLLNKYLKPQSGEKKKKKKKHVKGAGLRIIDDDVDTSRLRPLEADEIDALGLDDEDGPQIAGIVDERPEHIKEMEKFKAGSKWRIISQKDGGESKLRVEEVERETQRAKEETSVIFGKMYSDSEDEKRDSDQSPPRKKTNSNSNKQKFKTKDNNAKSGNNKRNIEKERCNSDSDLSPPRSRNRKVSPDQSPQRRNTKVNSKKIAKLSGSDNSPPRRNEIKLKDGRKKASRWGHFPTEEQHKKDTDVSKKANRQSNDSDISPPRRSKISPAMYIKNSDSDISPPRKTNRPIKKERSVDSDFSPPRKTKDFIVRRDLSPLRKERDRNSEVKRNISPRRKREARRYEHNRDKSVDSDLSPPRRKGGNRTETTNNSHLSPPRRKDINIIESKSKRGRSMSPRRVQDSRERRDYKTDSRAKGAVRYDDSRRKHDSPPPSNRKMERTLEGKTAGLQDARSMRDEAAILRRREDEFYNKMAPEVSGREATTVNRRLGKKETSEERQKNREKADRQREMQEKYDRWGKGLKQISDQERRLEDYIHEASKPLARTRDDADLERALKAADREGDPMLQYVKNKQRDEQPERPSYKGDWPPNRFNIRPGYRWDGVDRSNGYEKKYFDNKSKNKALEEEAYKWSTEDL